MKTDIKVMTEKDYGYEYHINASYYGEPIMVREMGKDEMLDDGITYYCDQFASIYKEGDANFKLI